MALVYTGNELIEAVRNLGMIPDAGSVGARDEDILDHLSAILQSKIVPELLKIREEYFVSTTRTDIVAGQTRYRIPTRAIGNKLRDICYVDDDNNRKQLDPIPREDLQEYNASNGSSEPWGYYMEGNYIVLVPDMDSSAGGKLEITFYFRPSDLVLSTSARQITGISGQVITCASDLPATWTVANTFDIHSASSGAEVKLWDLASTLVGPVGNENQITITQAINGSTYGTYAAAIGDWLCLSGEAVIPQIPRDFHPVLVRGAALRIAEAFGDMQGVQLHGSLFQADLNGAVQLMESRVEGKPLRLSGRRSILWGLDD